MEDDAGHLHCPTVHHSGHPVPAAGVSSMANGQGAGGGGLRRSLQGKKETFSKIFICHERIEHASF